MFIVCSLLYLRGGVGDQISHLAIDFLPSMAPIIQHQDDDEDDVKDDVEDDVEENNDDKVDGNRFLVLDGANPPPVLRI